MFELIEEAGWPIWPLIIASVIGLALIIERALALRTKKVIPYGLLPDVLNQARYPVKPDMLERLRQNSMLGQVLATGLANRHTDKAHLQDVLEATGRQVAAQLEKFLPVLSMIASIAPLMGLLGTVVGMIEIFGSQQQGMGSDPQVLAHGISVALYNTAFGLIVAIPAAIAHRIYRIRVDNQLHILENAARQLQEVLISTPIKTP